MNPENALSETQNHVVVLGRITANRRVRAKNGLRRFAREISIAYSFGQATLFPTVYLGGRIYLNHLQTKTHAQTQANKQKQRRCSGYWFLDYREVPQALPKIKWVLQK